MNRVHNLHTAIEKYLLLYHTKDVFITVGYWLYAQPTRIHIYVLKLQRVKYHEQNVSLQPGSFPLKLIYTGYWHPALRYFPINK